MFARSSEAGEIIGGAFVVLRQLAARAANQSHIGHRAGSNRCDATTQGPDIPFPIRMDSVAKKDQKHLAGRIVHPDRYGKGDPPLKLRFTSDEPGVVYDDVMGEFDLRVLAADLTNAAGVNTPLALGWGGDRIRVYETPTGPALVWYVVWDDLTARTRWLASSGQQLESRRRLGYRLQISESTIAGHPASRIVTGPEDWQGWKKLAEVQLVP